MQYSQRDSQRHPPGTTPFSSSQENRQPESHAPGSMYENALSFGVGREPRTHEGDAFGIGSIGNEGRYSMDIDDTSMQPSVSICCTDRS